MRMVKSAFACPSCKQKVCMLSSIITQEEDIICRCEYLILLSDYEPEATTQTVMHSLMWYSLN